jgi:hypothetical protein
MSRLPAAFGGPAAPALAAETVATPDERLTRENAYLRQRNAQLQDDVTALGAEASRLRQIVERLHGRDAGLANDPSRGTTP